jgi:hypothetical protein
MFVSVPAYRYWTYRGGKAMNRKRWAVAALVLVFTVTISAVTLRSTSSGKTDHIQLTSSGGCYGASCNGKNPMGLCESDAFTAAAMGVAGGMLELRYSPSCKANWGRYTQYNRELNTLYPRMTAWNPGGTSYRMAHVGFGPNSYACNSAHGPASSHRGPRTPWL